MNDAIEASNAIANQVNTSVATGAQWAQGQAALDLKKQSLQMERQQHDEMKRQFQIKVGQDLHAMIGDAVTEYEGPVKKAKIAAIQQFAEQAQIQLDPTQVASWSDETYKPPLGKLFKLVGATDAQSAAGEAYFSSVIPHIGQKASLSEIEKALSAMSIANAKQMQITAGQNRTTERISATETNKALGMAKQGSDNDLMVLGAVKRLNDQFDAVVSGKLVDRNSLLNAMKLEKSKIEFGTGRLPMGVVERQGGESTAGWISQKIEQLTNAPAGANIQEFAKQLVGEGKTLQGQYMQDIDTHHEMLREGFADYPKAQQSVDRLYGALRKNVSAPEYLGSWDGMDKYKIKGQEKAGGKQAPQEPAAPPDKVKQAQAYQSMLYDTKRPLSAADKESLKVSAKKVLAKFPGLLKQYGLE